MQWFLLLLGNLHWPFLPLEHLKKYNVVSTKHVFNQKYYGSKKFLDLILENSLYRTNSSWTSQPRCTYQNKQSFTRAKISFPSEGKQQSNVTHVYFIPAQAVSVNITSFFFQTKVCMQNSEEYKELPDPSANTSCLTSLWHLDNDICLNYKLCYCSIPDW